MTTHPLLTDRAALARNRSRALRLGQAPYLHERAIIEIKERLHEVNRTFTDVAIVTGLPGIWRAEFPGARVVGDEDVLDLAPGSHDLVIHAMSLHWANDPVGQMIQCRLALRPDGLFIAALPGGQSLKELRTALSEAEAAVAGGLSPRVLPMAEIRDLGALLQRAGFALPVADLVPLTVSFRDLGHLADDLRRMGEGNALAGRGGNRRLARQMFRAASEIYRRHFSDGKDRILATFDTVYLTGWAPAPGQQKPLRPGSAAARLADALGATETRLSAEPVKRSD